MSKTKTTPAHTPTPNPTETPGGPQSTNYYQQLAQQYHLQLPPVARQPRWWPRFLRSTTYQSAPLPTQPGALLRTVFARNWWVLLVATIIAITNYVAIALIPRGLGQLLDSGLERGLGLHLLPWTIGLIVLILIAAAASMINQLTEIATWLNGTIAVAKVSCERAINNSVAVSAKIPSGDVVATISSDVNYIGVLMEFIPSTAGALTSTVLVAILMLQVSVKLALVVIIGLPLVILGVTGLIKPLQQRQNEQREAQGHLTSITTDAVAGLRVLRGIGGEEEFDRRYREQSQRVRNLGVRIAPLQALLNAWREGMPGLFSTVIVAFAAMMVYDGEISPGDMVAFYGYTTFMMAPIWSLTNAIQFGTRAWVAARKVGSVFAIKPTANETSQATEPQWENTTLLDHHSGVKIQPGKLTALVCAEPNQSAEVAKRLAGTGPLTGVHYGQTPAETLKTSSIRRGIILASASDHLFSGTLRSNLKGQRATIAPAYHIKEIIYRDVIERLANNDEALTLDTTDPEDPQLTAAMHVADGADIITGLPRGLNGKIAERGRSLSGGQRQRVALARAIATEAPILIFIEPTSAVDSHTEARIGQRLRQHREGRTTVLVTASPLLLEQCDEIIVLDRQTGQAIARDTHTQLIERAHHGDHVAAHYRAIVQRATGIDAKED